MLKHLYLIINKINGYIQESTGNKKYEKFWSKIKDLTRSMTNNSQLQCEIYENLSKIMQKICFS